MSSEVENLDKCYKAVSDVVQKAGDVIKIHIFLFYKLIHFEWKPIFLYFILVDCQSILEE